MLEEGNQGETSLLDEGQGDAENIEEELKANISNSSPSPLKRGRGRPKKFKKSDQQVWTASSNEIESGLDFQNGSPIPPRRERGRPKGSVKKHTAHESVGLYEESSADTANDGPFQPLRGRGRPKGSAAKKRLVPTVSSEEGSGAETFNVDHESPKRGRGRPKGSISKKPKVQRVAAVASEEDSGENSSCSPNPAKKGRGRPKGSVSKELKAESAASSEEGSRSIPLKKRGRPKGSFSKTVILKECSVRIEELDLSNGNLTLPKRGRGRPKGSGAREAPMLKVYGKPRKMCRLPSSTKCGRPNKVKTKRGRPRKFPLAPEEEDNEMNKPKKKLPKVWKPLGRPRIYPRAERSTADEPLERRGRGRPRKTESKKGAHLRKNTSTPAKRGSPNAPAKNTGDVARKMGRPKGCVKARKIDVKGELDGAPRAKRIRQLNGSDTQKPVARRGRRKTASVSYVEEEEELENGEPQVKEELEEAEPECISQMVEDADESEAGFAPLEESDLSVSTESAMN